MHDFTLHDLQCFDAVVEAVEEQGGRFATFAEVIASGELAAAATVSGPDLLAL